MTSADFPNTARADPIKYHSTEARRLLEVTIAGLEGNGIATVGLGGKDGTKLYAADLKLSHTCTLPSLLTNQSSASLTNAARDDVLLVLLAKTRAAIHEILQVQHGARQDEGFASCASQIESVSHFTNIVPAPNSGSPW